jgi:serine/threonine-protein kinase
MGSFTPAPNALAPGDRLDRYELLCILAQGGMGTVWLARLTGKHGFERLVALKTILPSYGNDRTFVDMFLDEAKIAAQIDHENVVRTLEIGEDRDVLYHAMELIDGESVRKLYRDVRAAAAAFPLGVALRIASDVCAGLHAVHELRDSTGTLLEVVHRDVSPQNILLTTRGTVKLIDFGVAKAKERRTEETTAGTLKGKIEYMAPEQANGSKADRRADVYAVGAVLYELLAGEPVRNTEDGRQLLALHELMTGAPYEPLHAGVPLPVRTLVDRALANDPEDRFRTAEDMRRAIESAMTSIGLIATSDDVANALAQYSRERTTRRKDAIDAAVRIAQALEKEKAGDPRTGPGAPSQRALPAAASSRGSFRSLTPETGIKGTLVQPLAPPHPPVTGPLPASSARHPLDGQIVMGPNGPEVFGGMPPPISSGQLPGMPGEGPATGPSMRTVSVTQPPPSPSTGSRVGTVAILALVGVLGVGAGVLVARQPARTASDTPPATVTYVPATPPPPVTTPPPVVTPTVLPLPLPAPLPATSATTTKSAASAEKSEKPVEKPKPKPKTKKKGDGDEYGF